MYLNSSPINKTLILNTILEKIAIIYIFLKIFFIYFFRSGVYMSDFLYMMGEIDDRVRPLVFAVRGWAKAVGITNSSPGRWITNFSLSLLVLTFLQNPLKSPPILPSLNTLVKLSGKSSSTTLDNGLF